MAYIENYGSPLKGEPEYYLGEIEVGEKKSGKLIEGTFKGVHTENPLIMKVGLVEMEDGAKYIGWLEDNEKDYGVLYLQNGVRYYGSFANDRPENGIAVFPDGAVMIAENFDENGYMNKGLFYWPDRTRWLDASFQDGIAIRGEYVESDVVSSISEVGTIDLRQYHV